MHSRHGVLWVEVKAPKPRKRPEDLLSIAQKGWHAAAEDYGQVVVTVDSVDCLLEKLRELGMLEEVAA